MKKFFTKLYFLITSLVIIACTLISMLLLSGFILPYNGVGLSNYPTMSNNTFGICIKKEPKRFEFVSIEKELGDFSGVIKRVVGMPGDSVKIISGNTYINDELIYEKYAYYGTDEIKNSYDIDEIALADDEYFIFGDNRAESYDSKYFGPVKKADIECTVLYWKNK